MSFETQRHVVRGLPALLVGILLSIPATAQFAQQAKLVASTSGAPEQGYTVALSEDGDTALLGAPCYPTCPDQPVPSEGGAWVMTRANGAWSVAAGPLTGYGEAGDGLALSGDGLTAILGAPGYQGSGGAPVGAVFIYGYANNAWSLQAQINNIGGWGVALSYDGNTALVGPGDDAGVEAVFVFTRRRGVWTQQATITAGDIIGAADFGQSVALSRNGKTALIGGPGDNGGAGAAWIFALAGGEWRETAKLLGTAAIGNADQGSSVALSPAGNFAIVGGPNDDNPNPGYSRAPGAAWTFAHIRGAWTQEAKIVAPDAVGDASQGTAVSLSNKGEIALIGGPADNSGAGAAWAYKRSGSTWGEQAKLVGNGAIGEAAQGTSVAVSGDGSTALVGGPDDDTVHLGGPYYGTIGAGWAYTQTNERSR